MSENSPGREDPKQANESPPKAVQMGGPLGGIFPYGRFQNDVEQTTSGEDPNRSRSEDMETLHQKDCIVSWVRDRLIRFLDQPEGLCPACREKLKGIVGLLTELTEGRADLKALNELQDSCEQLQRDGHCERAREAVNPVVTSLRSFHDEYAMHAVNKHCPARVCPRLIPAPCHQACPAGIDIPSYLALLSHGRYEEALDVIREDNPFAWVCGLICPHPCESVCVRANLDDPINIRYLKAFAAEQTTERQSYPVSRTAAPQGHKVAVIGSGPAGLSAAYYLALKGYQVTIFEALPVAGGLLMVGIPEYRLPRAIVQREIDSLRSMGIEIRTGVTVGKDISFDALRGEGFRAFFLGIGAHQGYKLGIEGEEDFSQVYDAITFLRQVSLGNRQKPADRVVVIGGGNSAMDAARTCIRLGCPEVHVAYRRTRDEMPANAHEVEEAIEEGVQFHFLAVPVKVGGSDGAVTNLECLQAELGQPDASGRRRPIPVPDSNFQIDVGAVIAAIGQQPDFRLFSYELPFETTKRNLIQTTKPHTRTSVEDIFAGGDAVTGPATVVEAIAAGKQAAIDIDHYLQGLPGPAPLFQLYKRRRVPFHLMTASEKMADGRVPLPLRAPEERRQDFGPVELSYTEEAAQKEARRCLRCDICIRCGTCERVCRECMQVQALDFEAIQPEGRILNDYEKVGERCITCGACALACPTQAIEYSEADGKRQVRLCGTLLNELETLTCDDCGETFVPQRYLEHVTGRSDAVTGKQVLRKLCPKCARKRRAQNFVKF